VDTWSEVVEIVAETVGKLFIGNEVSRRRALVLHGGTVEKA
jgi:hypothetical protein